MKVLVIGYGLLGSEIVKQTGWSYVSRKDHKIDFTDPCTYLRYLEPYDTILNCVAITNTYGSNKNDCREVNYKAVTELSDICKGSDRKSVV